MYYEDIHIKPNGTLWQELMEKDINEDDEHVEKIPIEPNTPRMIATLLPYHYNRRPHMDISDKTVGMDENTEI